MEVKIVAIVMFLTGSAAVFGNFLWLIGVLPRPEEHLLDTRWLYALISYGISFLLIVAASDFK